jgi:NAD(P)-dependent dehydrogenase (short-subunit alcohol dehydrogenase family)
VELPVDEFMIALTTIVRSHFLTARAAARHMINQKSGVIIFVTESPARPHVPGATAIGAAFGAIESLTGNLAFEVSPLGVRVVCLRTVANVDSRPIQETMDFVASRMNITKEQAIGQVALSNFLKVPATVQDTANAAVPIASLPGHPHEPLSTVNTSPLLCGSNRTLTRSENGAVDRERFTRQTPKTASD